MARKKFTMSVIENAVCEIGKSAQFTWDSESPSLGLRVTPTGAKSFIFQAKLKGKRDVVRLKLGDVRNLTIEQAREEARELKSKTEKGIDPRQVARNEEQKRQEELKAAEEKRLAELKAIEEAKIESARQRMRDSVTLGMVWPIYIATKRTAKRKGGKVGWSVWHVRDHENVVQRGGLKKARGKGLTENGVLAELLDVPLASLTGERIAAWLAKETLTRPTRAALAFRLLSVFINWCDSHDEYKGLVPAGVCKTNIVQNEIPAKNSKTGDSLQREQLPAWFKAVRQIANPVQSAYLQSLLLTGARRRELGTLRWADIDFQWNTLTIRDKIEGERTIPLTPFVSHLLASLPRRNKWVFSSTSAKSGQLVEPTPAHKKALLSAGLPDITLHGLRRSFGSLAEWTETPAGIVAQIMGHKPSAIAEKHYRDRPIDLLRMWHVKLEAWILEQAQIDFVPAPSGLRIVSNT